MARRADHTRDELKELAIDAGRQLIQEEGFSGFSARKAAARIGYTVGTLYNVFGSYDGYILHMNARTLDEWFEAMQKALARSRDTNKLRALAKFYIAYAREHYRLWIVLFEHHIGPEEPLPEWYVPKMARFFAVTEELLMKEAGINRARARRAARVLWAGIHGICTLSLSGTLEVVGAESAETLALSLVDTYMAGFRA